MCAQASLCWTAWQELLAQALASIWRRSMSALLMQADPPVGACAHLAALHEKLVIVLAAQLLGAIKAAANLKALQEHCQIIEQIKTTICHGTSQLQKQGSTSSGDTP